MTNPDEDYVEPAHLRLLRRLVTVLTIVMIGGLVIIVALIVIRFSNKPVPLPDAIALPDGAKATAFTQGHDWYAVVTADDQIIIFDRASGDIRQTIVITPGE